MAAEDGTTVTITPSVTTGSRAKGVPYTVRLDSGRVYQLTNTGSADLSGTLVQSDKPVAVFGGHKCAYVPRTAVACDHLAEQVPPTTTWGKDFVTVPLATRKNGDTFRFMAAEAGTEVPRYLRHLYGNAKPDGTRARADDARAPDGQGR